MVKEAQELAEVFEGIKSLKNKLSEANRKKQLEPFRALLAEARSNADFRSIFQEDLAQAERAFAVLERTPLVLKALQEVIDLTFSESCVECSNHTLQSARREVLI